MYSTVLYEEAVVIYDFKIGLPFSEIKIIPRNTEQTEILINSVGTPSVFDFVSQPYFRARKFDVFRHLHKYPNTDYLT